MRQVRWSVLALAVYAGLLFFAGLLFVAARGAKLLDDDPGSTGVFWLLSFAGTTLLGTWILILVWIFVDAERRGMSGPLWTFVVFLLLFPIGPLLFLILRRPVLGVCPGCRQNVDASFANCPRCGRSLRRVCPNCRTGLQAGWRVCPSCGRTAPGFEPEPETRSPPAG